SRAAGRPHAMPARARQCPGRWRTDSAEPAGPGTFAALGADPSQGAAVWTFCPPGVAMLPLFWIRDEGPAVAPGPALSWFSRGAARGGGTLRGRDPRPRGSPGGP